MAKLSKKRKASNEKLEEEKIYSLAEASTLVKEVNTAKFDASIDLHIRLGVDPRKADQAIRGTVSLPHGTGKEKKVLVFCTADKEEEAKAAGADYVGLDEYIEKLWSAGVKHIVALRGDLPQGTSFTDFVGDDYYDYTSNFVTALKAKHNKVAVQLSRALAIIYHRHTKFDLAIPYLNYTIKNVKFSLRFKPTIGCIHLHFCHIFLVGLQIG